MLTDTDALAELLKTADETLLRRPYLRWKPGTSCIAALELASGPAYAAAFSATAGAKLVKTLEQAPAGSVLLVDRRLVCPRGPALGGPGPPRSPRSGRRPRSCGAGLLPDPMEVISADAGVQTAPALGRDPVHRPGSRRATAGGTSCGPIGGGTWSGPGPV